MIIIAISREFESEPAETWRGGLTAQSWRAYVLEMLAGKPLKSRSRTTSVRLRTDHGMVIIKPKRLKSAEPNGGQT